MTNTNKILIIIIFINFIVIAHFITSNNQEQLKIQEQNNLQQEDYDDYLDDIQVARWKNPKKLKVYIDYNDPQGQIFKDAFIMWDDLLGNSVNFIFINSPNDAQITCYHVDSIDESGKLGITDSSVYSYNNEPNKFYMKKAKIKVLKKDKGTNKYFNEIETKAITLHEIGHALGIKDHSPKQYDLMYENTQNYMNDKARPSNRDINTIKRMYK